MPKPLTVLLIEDSADYAALVKQWLLLRTDFDSVLNWADSLQGGLNRLRRGGVDVILLDLGLPDSLGIHTLARTKLEAFGVPIILLSADHTDELALQMVKDGAEDFIAKSSCNGHVLVKAIQYALARNNGRKKDGEILSFIGAKGGVGATTVALNVASVLAGSAKVILVEMRPAFGTLLPYFKPDRQIRNTSHLLRADSAEFDTAEVSACLWPCKAVPGLSVLFGPQLPAECGDLAPDRVKRLLKSLSRIADYLVLDLPASLSDANRAAVQESGRLILVQELDPVCVRLAKLVGQAISAWEGAPGPIENVLVNRASVSCPMPVSEIEIQLGHALLGIVPPGPDVCLAAQNTGKPLVAFQPDGILADSLINLAEKCASPVSPLAVMA